MKSETHNWFGRSARNCRLTPVQRIGRLVVADRRAHHLAAHHTAQSLTTHQSFDGASRNRSTFTGQLTPDLISAVDLHIGPPDTLDLRHQLFVTSSPRRSQCGVPAVELRNDGTPDGAIRSTLQIGSTPYVARCTSMKSLIT